MRKEWAAPLAATLALAGAGCSKPDVKPPPITQISLSPDQINMRTLVANKDVIIEVGKQISTIINGSSDTGYWQGLLGDYTHPDSWNEHFLLQDNVLKYTQARDRLIGSPELIVGYSRHGGGHADITMGIQLSWSDGKINTTTAPPYILTSTNNRDLGAIASSVFSLPGGLDDALNSSWDSSIPGYSIWRASYQGEDYVITVYHDRDPNHNPLDRTLTLAWTHTI